MSEETIFTKIINREIPANIVYEDDKHIAFLDIFPWVKGHTMVVPKKIYPNIADMPEENYLELQKVVLKLVKHYRELFNCKIGTQVYGLDVPHVHIHVFPITDEIEVFNFGKTKKYLPNEAENYQKRLELK